MKKFFITMMMLLTALTAQNAWALTASVSNGSGNPSQDVSVAVNFSDNTLQKIVGVKVWVEYDANILNLNSIGLGPVVNGVLTPTINVTQAGRGIAILDGNEPGFSNASGHILTCNFTIKAGAPSGTTPVHISVFDLENLDEGAL